MINVTLFNTANGAAYACDKISVEGSKLKIVIESYMAIDHLIVSCRGKLVTFTLNCNHVMQVGDTFDVQMGTEFLEFYREAMGYLYQDVL